jgi:2OG-Fe(II) oxygenase superfamily
MNEKIYEVEGRTVVEYESANIFEIKNFIDSETCDDIIELIKKLPLKEIDYTQYNNVKCYFANLDDLLKINDSLFYEFSTDTSTYDEMMNNIRRKQIPYNNLLNGVNLKELQSLEKKLNDSMKAIRSIVTNSNSFIKFGSNFGFCLRKITGPTRLHSDGILNRSFNPNIVYFKNDISISKSYMRSASIVITLNDDYEGGIFKFPLQNISIKPKKGSILIFPPYWTHPHEVTKPENDSFRYTINTWTSDR